MNQGVSFGLNERGTIVTGGLINPHYVEIPQEPINPLYTVLSSVALSLYSDAIVSFSGTDGVFVSVQTAEDIVGYTNRVLAHRGSLKGFDVVDGQIVEADIRVGAVFRNVLGRETFPSVVDKSKVAESDE